MSGTARPPSRPEIECSIADLATIAAVAQPLSAWRRLIDSTGARRIAIVVVLCGLWQAYAAALDNGLIFPTLSATAAAWWSAVISGELPARVLTSVEVLAVGYALGVAVAALLTAFAISSRLGGDFLSSTAAMLNPLPGVALLPVALLWFGLGTPSIVFVLVHSVVWPLALSTYSGFLAVPLQLRMVGNNYGLTGVRLIVKILVPAALPSIVAGLKIGWAFAWRTLIAAELVFGVSSRSGGLGWFIYTNRNQLDIASVFAGLLTIIAIGLVMESVVFRTIEERTVRRWGMQ